MQIIVLFHGYNLNATGMGGIRLQSGMLADYPHRDWETVCVGDGKRKGRLRVVLQLVRDFNPQHVIFSTGCTWTAEGMSEARYSFERALDLAGEYDVARAHLENIALFDEKSVSTSHTIVEIGGWFRKGRFGSEPTYLMHVASSNHAPRVLRDAMKGQFEDLPFVTPMFIPAETAYADGHPSQTIVDDLGKSFVPKSLIKDLLNWGFGGTG